MQIMTYTNSHGVKGAPVAGSFMTNVLKNSLKIIHFNSRSILNKIDEVELIVASKNPDIICVSETWLKPEYTNNAVSLIGYNLLRHDRSVNRGGGVCIYFKNKTANIIEKSSTKSSIEYLIVQLPYKNCKLLIGVFYIPPQFSNNTTTLDELDNILQKYSTQYDNLLFTGDFNIDLLKNNNYSNNFVQILKDQGLSVLNETIPTHVSSLSSSLLDIFITNNPDKSSLYEQCSIPSISDHELISCSYALLNEVCNDHFSYRDYNSFNFNLFENTFYTLDWSAIDFATNIDEKLHIFNTYIYQLYDASVPIRTVNPTKKNPPWLTKQISLLLVDRNLAFSKWKFIRDDESRENYKRLRNQTTNMIREEKNKYLKSKVNPNIPPKKLWNNIKELGLGKCNNFSTSPFTADEFNTYFATICSTTTKQDTFQKKQLPKFEGFSFELICETEVIDAFRKISSNAIGVDGIPLKFLKVIFFFILPIIVNIFNSIITMSQFPTCWKRGKIVPIPKIKSPTEIKDFRPITILPTLSKIFEVVLKNQISQFLHSNKLLSQFQSGFRPHHSTTSALLHITDDIRMNLNNKYSTLLILLDFSKAFDTINHNILLNKLLDEFNFSSSAVNLIGSYLSSRTHLCFSNGKYSSAPFRLTKEYLRDRS